MDYINFIKSKTIKKTDNGIEVDLSSDDRLFPFQRKCVEWALSKGCSALFEACGLGKTRQQLIWAEQIIKTFGGNVLIVAPLGVARQTANEEASAIGLKVKICRSQKDVETGINITNYEMIDKFDASKFIGVVLDESSILKNFTGSTKKILNEMFVNTPYKLCCTATPAPNDYIELLNHADFLGVMKTSQALATFFINDFKTGEWRLKGHATTDFWKWVCSWAINIDSPSDLGFDSTDYILPKLKENYQILTIDEIAEEDFTNGLFRDIGTSATSFYKEKKRTAEQRAIKCSELINNNDQYIIWCDTNNEADLLKKYIPQAVEVRGDDSPSYKEECADKFKKGEIQVLISKPKIFGYGMNFQKCHNMIFCGLTYSYENYYQAVRRIYRFGQKNEVNVDIVIGSTEEHILKTIQEKAEKQRIIKNGMKNSIKDIQLLAIAKKEKNENISQSNIELPKW